MTGYCHEFQRTYRCDSDDNLGYAVRLGTVDAKYVPDPADEKYSVDQTLTGKGTLDELATRVRAPGPTQDFLNPANAESIKDCQTWALEYVRLLVSCGYIDGGAIEIAESQVEQAKAVGLKPTGAAGIDLTK